MAELLQRLLTESRVVGAQDVWGDLADAEPSLRPDAFDGVRQLIH